MAGGKSDGSVAVEKNGFSSYRLRDGRTSHEVTQSHHRCQWPVSSRRLVFTARPPGQLKQATRGMAGRPTDCTPSPPLPPTNPLAAMTEAEGTSQWPSITCAVHLSFLHPFMQLRLHCEWALGKPERSVAPLVNQLY